VFKISLRAEVVTYPRRNVTMVCGASYHIFGSCVYLQDTKDPVSTSSRILQGLTWRSGSLTRLASDLSWARQKYVCTVQKYVCMVQF
jgi:hypothetical protein